MSARPVVLMMDALDALGGVQRVLRTLADGFADRGRAVRLVGLYPASPPRPLPTRHPHPELVLHDREPRLLYSPMTAWQRAKLTLRGAGGGVREFDRGAGRLADALAADDGVVVATQLRSAEYCVRAGIPADRLIVQYHDSAAAARRGDDLARLRRLAPRAARVLALNAEDAAQLRADGVPGVGHLRNPLVPGGAPVAPGPRDPVVVMGARYEPQKALDVAIRGFASIAARHPGWSMRIYGEGSQRAPLSALIDRLGAPVVLAGATDDFPGVLRRALVHALSSAHEGMGLVIAEAMAAGTPTVSTDSGPGVRELIDDERTGLLTPVGDVAAFGRALDRCLSDEALRARIAAAAGERLERFGVEAVLDDWDRILADQSTGPAPDPVANR